jgi:hypothetical protein
VIFEKQCKSKGEIRNSANGRLQLKKSKWRGLNSKIPIATLLVLLTVSKSKMELMVSCDENPHIVYRWKEHGEENTMR